jgi:hypothetical protein
MYFDSKIGKFMVYDGQNWTMMTTAIFEDERPYLEYNTGDVYGQPYLTIKPHHMNWFDIEKWCTGTFGRAGNDMWGVDEPPNPASRWYANNAKFWFRDRRDYDWFILRWSS